MFRVARTLKIAGMLLVAGTLAACSTSSEKEAPPVTTTQPSATSIKPGTAEDFRVNVGDTVFFDTDQHSPWHIFNFWVDMLFHMGWLGVGAFACVLLQALNCLRLKLKNHAFAAIQLASFSGFFIVGFVDSPFDAPRLSLLFTLMLFLALSQEKPFPTSQHNLVV
jgi:hypothetical protein